jgi:hypothetical protein
MLSLRTSQNVELITSISLDSRSRRPGDSLSDYSISLVHTLTRLKTVQLGSIMLPPSTIQTVTSTMNSNLLYSEPITIPGGTVLKLQETVTTTSLTGETLSTVPGSVVTITIPPTLNEIVSVAANGQAVTTTQNHGLDFALNSYPSVGLSVSLVGGLYPAPTAATALLWPPQLTATSLVAPGATPSTTFSFVPGFLNSFIPTDTGTNNTRNSTGAYKSYIYSEPPTYSELLQMLNSSLQSQSGLTLPVSLAIEDASNSCIIRCEPRSVRRSSSIVTTTTSLVAASPGETNVLSFLGFSNSALPLYRAGGQRVPVSSAPGMRQVVLNPGNYSYLDVAAMLSTRLSPLDFNTTTATQRTLHWVSSSGTSFALEIPRGRYSGSQLAGVLAGLMVTATTAAGENSDYSVTYLSSGRFVFSQTAGLHMGLDFTAALDGNTALLLGFQPLSYTGASSFTSPLVAVVGVSSSQTFPSNRFGVLTDSGTQRFSISSVADPTVYSDSVVAPLSWSTLQAAAGAALVPGGYLSGDVLQVTLSGAGPFPTGLAAGNTLTVVVDSAWDGITGAVPYVSVRNSASINGTGGGGRAGTGDPTANVIMALTPLKRSVFQLHMAGVGAASGLLGLPVQTLPPLRSLGQVVPQTSSSSPSYYYSGSGSGSLSTLISPYAWNMVGAEYILMRLAQDMDETTNNQHAWMGGTTGILAKIYTNVAFRHISEEMLHCSFIGTKKVSNLRVQFLNPDGTFVDFAGREHSYSLLFTSEQGRASAICT